MAQRAVAMRPGAEDQPARPAPGMLEAEIVLDRSSRVRVVPARQVHGRHLGVVLVIAFGVNPGLLPELVEAAVRPLLEQIVFVFRGRGERRGTAMPTLLRQA